MGRRLRAENGGVLCGYFILGTRYSKVPTYLHRYVVYICSTCNEEGKGRDSQSSDKAAQLAVATTVLLYSRYGQAMNRHS